MAYPYDLIFNNKFVKFLKSYSSALTIQYEPAAVYHCVYHIKKYVKKRNLMLVYSICIYFGNPPCYKCWNCRGESVLMLAVNKVTISCGSQILKKLCHITKISIVLVCKEC